MPSQLPIDDAAVGRSCHDLSNVLAAILGSAEFIVSDAEEGSQIAEDAGTIRAAALRGRELLEELRLQLNL